MDRLYSVDILPDSTHQQKCINKCENVCSHSFLVSMCCQLEENMVFILSLLHWVNLLTVYFKDCQQEQQIV